MADRDFLYPEGVPPTVVAFTQSRPLLDNPYAETGVKVITLPDLRWKRRDIKSTALLAQTMGKQEAKRRGAYEAGWSRMASSPRARHLPPSSSM